MVDTAQGPGDETPAIIIYGSAITRMDPEHRQLLAGALALQAGSRALVGTVDLSAQAPMYEAKVRGLALEDEVPPFTIFIQRDRNHYPPREVFWDCRKVVDVVCAEVPDIIEDPASTVKALSAVIHYGGAPACSNLFERRFSSDNKICAVTFLDPQFAVAQTASVAEWVPRLGPKTSRALGLFVIANTRLRVRNLPARSILPIKF